MGFCSLLGATGLWPAIGFEILVPRILSWGCPGVAYDLGPIVLNPPGSTHCIRTQSEVTLKWYYGT